MHYNPATNEISEEFPLAGPTPEDSEEKAAHLFGHGLPGRLLQAMRDGTYWLLGEGETETWAGRLLRRSRARWISLVACWGGTPLDLDGGRGRMGRGEAAGVPFVVDPLRDVPAGQPVANACRLPVRAPDHIHAPMRNDAGRYVHALYTDAQGRRTRWRYFRPEPRSAELGRLARVAGLHRGPWPPPTRRGCARCGWYGR